MKTIKVKARSNSEGKIVMDIPVGEAGIECDVIVRVDPPNAPTEWLPGFWETLYEGAEKGGDIVRSPQSESPVRETAP